jgi:hypothetical protein
MDPVVHVEIFDPLPTQSQVRRNLQWDVAAPPQVGVGGWAGDFLLNAPLISTCSFGGVRAGQAATDLGAVRIEIIVVSEK